LDLSETTPARYNSFPWIRLITMRLIIVILLLFSLVPSVFTNPIPSPSTPFRQSLPPTTDHQGLPHHPDVELPNVGDDSRYAPLLWTFLERSISDPAVPLFAPSRSDIVTICVLAPDNVDQALMMNQLQAQGVTIVARARRNHEARSHFPNGALLVAPPGIKGDFPTKVAPDLWVHTDRNNWANAVFRTAGVAAEYSCDPAKYPVKASVLKLGQKRYPRCRQNFLLLEPLVATESYSLKPRPWVIKTPSNPWIDSSPTSGFADNTTPYSYPVEPRPRLPGITDTFSEEIWNPGS
ncbi:hypothetical protein H0H93_010142, partial [Arthromyces matolae]